MEKILLSIPLGIAGRLISDFVVAKLRGGPAKLLARAFNNALRNAAKEIAKTYDALLADWSQVYHFFRIDTEEFVPVLNALSEKDSPEIKRFISVVKKRFEVAQEGQPADSYVGLLRASDHELYQLLTEYVLCTMREISAQSRLLSYFCLAYHIYSNEQITRFAGQQLEEIGEVHKSILILGENVKRLTEQSNRLKVLRPVTPGTGEFAPYPLEQQEGYAVRFFGGREPTWRDVATGFGIRRKMWENTVYESIRRAEGNKAILVNAVAGAGKTNMLRTLALSLAFEGEYSLYEVTYFGRDTEALNSDLDSVFRSEPGEKKLVFLIDNAASRVDFWRGLVLNYRDRRNALWVFCDRTERWADTFDHPPRKITPHELGVDALDYKPLPVLSNLEIEELVDHLLAWGILKDTKRKEKWSELFKEKYEGKLLVTLLELQTEGKKGNFKTRLAEEGRDFGEYASGKGRGGAALKLLYPAVAALHRFGVFPTRQWLLQWLDNAGSTENLANQQAIGAALDAEVLIRSGGGRLQCRHEVIAEVVTNELLAGETLTEIYDIWITCTDRYNEDQVFEITQLFTHAIHRKRLWAVPDKLRLYEAVRKKFANYDFVQAAAAYCAIKSGRPELARIWFEETGADNKMILQYLAGDSARRGEIDRAKKEFNLALGLNGGTTPEDAFSELKRGGINIDLKLFSEWAGFLKNKLSRFDIAEGVYKLLIDKDIFDGTVYREFIWVRYKQNAPSAEIERLLSEAENKLPNDVPFFVMLRAEINKANGHEILRKAIEEGREDEAVRLEFIKGLPRITDSETRNLFTEYNRAIEKYPEDSHLRHSFAEFLLSEGKVAEAKREFFYAIRLDPSNAAPYLSFARFYDSKGEPEKATTWFEKGLDADPTDPYLVRAYALFLYQQEKYKEARPHFEMALALEPSDSYARITYALSLVKTGFYLEAEEQLHAVLVGKIDETYCWAVLIKFYKDFGFKRAAFACAGEALNYVTPDPPLTQTAALCYWDLCHYQEALEVVRSGWATLQKMGTNIFLTPRMWAAQAQKLAEYLGIIGRKEEALDILKIAVEHAPDDERLVRLKDRLEKGFPIFKKILEGNFSAFGVKGATRRRSKSDNVYVYPIGEERPMPANKTKNACIPDDGWLPGIPLVFDVWQLPSGSKLAINIELEQWGWEGVGSLILPGVTIWPLRKP